MKTNSALSRFELEVDGKIAYANYRIAKNILNIDYVFSPPELRGTGVAGKLMEDIVKYAKEQNMEIVPICGYAAAWMKRHAS